MAGGADGADWWIGKRGGGPGGLKGIHILLLTSLSCVQSACFVRERVCRVFGSAVQMDIILL